MFTEYIYNIYLKYIKLEITQGSPTLVWCFNNCDIFIPFINI